MASPVAMAYAAELAPKGQEGKYMGTMTLAMFGGMGVGPFIGGSLTDAFSLKPIFYVGSAISFIGVGVFWVLQRGHEAAVTVLQ